MAMSFTYTTIKNAIFTWTEDSGTEFTANIDTIINLGLEMVVRDLDLEIFKGSDTGTFVQGSNDVNKPSAMLMLESLYYTDSNGKKVFLLERSKEYCMDYWPTASQQAAPKFISDSNDQQWYVVPTPNSGYTWSARFLQRPTPLSASNASNWVSTNAGDLLLYACLVQSEQFLMATNRGRVQAWADMYKDQLPKAKEELLKIARKTYNPIRPAAEIKEVQE